MGQQVAIPSWAHKALDPSFVPAAQGFKQSLADGIGQGYPVVYFRGKNWSMAYRGERKTFIRPDDGTPASYLDVVILDAAGHKSKSFYEKWDQNKAESGERPICSSIDGVAPDLDAQKPQAAACADCPRNVWKTDADGRRTRECSDGKRIAVLVLPSQTKAIFGQPIQEPAFLRVPAASLNALAILGQTMDGLGRPFFTYVTRITFDPQMSHPKMIFEAILPLEGESATAILELRNDPQVQRIINGGFVERRTALPPPQVSGLALPSPTVASQPVQPALAGNYIPTQSAPPATLDGLRPATAMTTAPGPSTTTSVASPTTSPPAGTTGPDLSGLGIAAPAPPPNSSPGSSLSAGNGAVASTTPGTDAGAPELADDDLDAAITAHLKTLQ